MALYLDTRGKSTLGIGICGRCSVKMSLEDLYPDPNTPGLRVCKDDLDNLDPWRLAPRESDQITLQYPRPDVSLAPGPEDVIVGPLQLVIMTGGGGPVGGADFSDNSGALTFVSPEPPPGWPTDPTGLPAGSVYYNAGVVGIVPGVTPNPAAPPLYFADNLTAAYLLQIGGGNLPYVPIEFGNGQITNKDGEAWIS